MLSVNFYQNHLNQVSRSFAFCIERLKSPLRERVSLMYLFCRVIDTAEDIPWAQSEMRKKFFADFRLALKEEASIDSLPSYNDSLFVTKLSSEEKSLLEDMPKLFAEYWQLTRGVREIICDLLFTMSHGMEIFLERAEASELKINNADELNIYCFYAAGVVGEALTRLIAFYDERQPTCEEIVQSYHFGLYLQKINILKDQDKDEAEGRYFVFDRSEVLKGLRVHAGESFQYIASIADSKKDYKTFCAWSFFLGLASLPYIEKAYKTKKEVKISRFKTLALIHKVEKMISQQKTPSLFKLFELYSSKYFANLLSDPAAESPEEVAVEATGVDSSLKKEIFVELIKPYRGLLPRQELWGVLLC